jgi:hypothetical protein
VLASDVLSSPVDEVSPLALAVSPLPPVDGPVLASVVDVVASPQSHCQAPSTQVAAQPSAHIAAAASQPAPAESPSLALIESPQPTSPTSPTAKKRARGDFVALGSIAGPIAQRAIVRTGEPAGAALLRPTTTLRARRFDRSSRRSPSSATAALRLREAYGSPRADLSNEPISVNRSR